MEKSVIVTGSSRGIGKAIALRFAQAGHKIVLNGVRDISQDLIDEVKEAGAADVIAISGDVSDFDFAESLIQETKEAFGSVDVLVNNAGMNRDGLLMRMSEEDFDDVIAVNLKGAFNLTRHAVKVMLKQKSGSIINMSSISGQMGNPGQANYAAAKAGVIGLTKSTAREVGSRGINVNAISPGFIKTDMTDAVADKYKKEILKQIPMNRYGEVEEVADLAYFLSTAQYITGQTITIDGGLVTNG